MATSTPSSRSKVAQLMYQRRRSAYELHAASMANHILSRYRRTSLHDGALKRAKSWERPQSTMNSCLKKKAKETEDSGCCSQRSSVSTAVDDDELASLEISEEDIKALDIVDPTPAFDNNSNGVEDEATDELMELQDVASHCHDQIAMASQRKKSSTASSASSSAASTSSVPRRQYGTVLRELPVNELYLFREEAEYSDYLTAMATGIHAEMDSVVFYELQVHLSQSKWTVLRRFSEFRALRQRLLKHFAKRQRLQSTKCRICANIQQSIEHVPFPSRKSHRKPWFAALRSRAYNRRLAAKSALVIAERKRKLEEFLATCLMTVRGLRQHSRLMCDSSACEIGVALRMIEEFLGLSFTRYMRFLTERGVLEGTDKPKGKGVHHGVQEHRARVAHASSLRAATHGRRATVAV